MHAFLSLLSALVAASAPPLSPAQAERLATAVDGGEFREVAFEALVQWTRDWDGEIGAAPVRIEPNLAAMARDPVTYRGDLCRLTGTIQQQNPLGPPYEVVEEWFVRDPDGVPFVVYVVVTGANAPSPAGFAGEGGGGGSTSAPTAPTLTLPRTGSGGGNLEIGDRIQIDARFYKRIDLVARDGKARGYPAFVGRAPRLLHESSDGAASGGGTAAAKSGRGDGADESMHRLWLVAGLVALMLVIFSVLFIYTRRKGVERHRLRSGLSAGWGAGELGELDAGPPLPDDPAEALAELKRRAAAPWN